MSTSRIMKLALIATATAAAAIAIPVAAHAGSHSFTFQSPSGNVGCEMWDQNVVGGGTGGVVCTIRDHTWAAPPPAGGHCQAAGDELKLFQGDPPCVGVWPNQIWLYPPPMLAYGQTHAVGTITCDSEPAGVTCTDASTGHSFRVSRESYQLG